LNLGSVKNWYNLHRNNQASSDVPMRANLTYLNSGWIDWYDFLGIKEPDRLGANRKSIKAWLSYEEATGVLAREGIRTFTEWVYYAETRDQIISQGCQ